MLNFGCMAFTITLQAEGKFDGAKLYELFEKMDEFRVSSNPETDRGKISIHHRDVFYQIYPTKGRVRIDVKDFDPYDAVQVIHKVVQEVSGQNPTFSVLYWAPLPRTTSRVFNDFWRANFEGHDYRPLDARWEAEVWRMLQIQNALDDLQRPDGPLRRLDRQIEVGFAVIELNLLYMYDRKALEDRLTELRSCNAGRICIKYVEEHLKAVLQDFETEETPDDRGFLCLLTSD